jgi:hypothetical protein
MDPDGSIGERRRGDEDVENRSDPLIGQTLSHYRIGARNSIDVPRLTSKREGS